MFYTRWSWVRRVFLIQSDRFFSFFVSSSVSSFFSIYPAYSSWWIATRGASWGGAKNNGMKAPRKQWLGYRYIFRRAIVYSQGTAEERRWRTKEMEGRRRKTQHICVCCIYIYVDAILCCVKISLCSFVFFYLSSSFSNILFFPPWPVVLHRMEKEEEGWAEKRKKTMKGWVGLRLVCVCELSHYLYLGTNQDRLISGSPLHYTIPPSRIAGARRRRRLLRLLYIY